MSLDKPTCVTLRSHLAGALTDVVEAAGLGRWCRCTAVAELVSLFVDYREEGVPLFLDAFLTDDLRRLTKVLPGSGHLRLGAAKCDGRGLQAAVKQAAPLTRGRWRMYLEPSTAGRVEFGVFRDAANPLSVSIEAVLQSGDVGDTPFIRVTRIAQNSVGVAAHGVRGVVVHFTNAAAGVEDADESIAKLSTLACSRLPKKPERTTTTTYIHSLLLRALRASHGALIAVTHGDEPPGFLKDCTPMQPHLDLYQTVLAVRGNATAIPQLNALEDLVFGVLSCDGIMLLNTKAQILAYRGFVKLNKASHAGGARRRAYEALCAKLGTCGLVAAYYQSQDGATDLRST